MVIPRWVTVALAIVAAIPFGWGLGVVVAYLLLGPEFGVFPALTIPLCSVVAIVFAVMPRFSAALRLAILVGGAVAFFALGNLLVR
jgi:hypothetical protein